MGLYTPSTAGRNNASDVLVSASIEPAPRFKRQSSSGRVYTQPAVCAHAATNAAVTVENQRTL